MISKTKIKKSEIKPGEAKTFFVGEERVVVCNVSNQFFAVEDVCSHDDGTLVFDKTCLIENSQLECPRHGARFDVKTGSATRMPAVAPIKTYKVVDLGNEEIEVNAEE